MPLIRPFRALRYEPEAVGDLALVVSPPYDVIGPEEQQRLLDRHPKNVVRLDLPAVEPGDEPDARYRRAARTFAAWRSDGTFHKDPRPGIYVYEQAYVVPGTQAERVERGFFARLRLEPLGMAGGILPHERTLAAPREDRYKLLRATGANFSPVVGLYRDSSGRAADILDGVVRGPATIDVRDDDAVRHRLWIVPARSPDEDGAPGPAAELARLAGLGSITIADGHHRYETALRYRDERRMTRSCEEDPAFDYILALLLESTGQQLTVLPTHRIARELDADGAQLLARAAELFDVRPLATRAELEDEMAATRLAGGGGGRIGLWTRNGGALLVARRADIERWLPSGSAALRNLDVTIAGVALERLAGIDPSETAAGRVGYTKSVAGALDAVDRRIDGADAALLLEPTPVADVAAVAEAGEVMPQKSTYFFPKPLSGLVINPHEW
ncbi:MAG TPA: DUF1015 domain-containing protein [Candidatus Limnocylindrales bacterium]